MYKKINQILKEARHGDKKEITGGKISSSIVDNYPQPIEDFEVPVTVFALTAYDRTKTN